MLDPDPLYCFVTKARQKAAVVRPDFLGHDSSQDQLEDQPTYFFYDFGQFVGGRSATG